MEMMSDSEIFPYCTVELIRLILAYKNSKATLYIFMKLISRSFHRKLSSTVSPRC
jgi:hypothetical protein